MTDPVLGYAIMAFVALAAISMLAQAIATMRVMRTVRELQQQVTPLIPRAEAALETARETLVEARGNLREISARTVAVLDNAKAQLARVEDVVTDAAARAKNQLERTEMVVEDTVSRVHETVAAVHSTILKPIREVNGLAAGIRAGVSQLFRRRREGLERVTQDEEMFI